MRHIKLFENNNYSIYELILMDSEELSEKFVHIVQQLDPDIETVQNFIDTGRIEIEYMDIIDIPNSKVRELILSKENSEYIKIKDIFTSNELKEKGIITYAKEFEDMLIFNVNPSMEYKLIFCEYEFKDMKLFRETTIIPISTENQYNVYIKDQDKMFLINLDDVEECYYGDRDIYSDDSIASLIGGYTNISQKEFIDDLFTHKLFHRIKNDTDIVERIPHNLKYNEKTNTYDAYLSDYEDFASLFPDDMVAVERILSGDLHYDYWESYDDGVLHYLNDDMINLVRSIIIKKNPDIDTNEIENERELFYYISNSDDNIAKELREHLERAWNMAYEGAYQGQLWDHIVEEAYNWLTGDYYHKDSLKFDENGKLLVKNIRLDLVILSMYFSSDFININVESEYFDDDERPEIDLERAESHVSVGRDWFCEHFIEVLLVEDVIDSEDIPKK